MRRHRGTHDGYKRYISNISYSFKFEVIYELGIEYDVERILKVEDGEITILSSSDEYPRNTLIWRAWLNLQEEYGYSGIWKDKL